MTRLLLAGPALLRTRHSAELASAAVDQVEAMDGLFRAGCRPRHWPWLGPVLVLIAALAVDRMASLVLLLTGLLVPVGQAVAGIGAATASRGQFQALARLQSRFLDRIRGIATIVLAGRAEDEAKSHSPWPPRNCASRTMRVLRVVFLSSAMLDCATAAALMILALRYRHDLASHAGSASLALFVLLLVPEFFAPLRGFAMAYKDRLHATGAAEALVSLPPMPEARRELPIRTVEAAGVAITFQNVRFTWDQTRGPALDGLSFVLPPGEMLVLAGPSGARQVHGHRIAARLHPARRGPHSGQRRRHRGHRAAGAVPPHRLDRPAAHVVRRARSAKTSASPAPRPRMPRSRKPRGRPACWISRRAAGRPGHADRRGRPRHFRRPGAARRYRARLPEERAAAAAR